MAGTTKTQWLEARAELLILEKAHSKAEAELARKRRDMPKLEIESDYVFEGADGQTKLSALFNGRSQLILQHFMFGVGWEAGCPICSFWADGYDRMVPHLNQRDISFAVISRGEIDRLQGYRARMGWNFHWLSSEHNSFNFDFGVSATDEELEAGSMVYNYQTRPVMGAEQHGTSVFELIGDKIYHTYSTYGRGLDRMNGAYGYIDLTPRGRTEDELPFTLAWVRRHDEY